MNCRYFLEKVAFAAKARWEATPRQANPADVMSLVDAPRAFSIDVPDADIDDLTSRLERTRWLEPLERAGWSYGTGYDYLQSLVEHWKTRFDWRAHERRLNRLPQYLMRVRDFDVHYIHIRSGDPFAVPLLLCHGWPGGINEFEKLATMLKERNTSAAPPFDVIIPSMPGFGFSSRPRAPGAGIHYIADLWRDLMLQLGYQRFGVHGGDWGSWVALALSRRSAQHVIGVHLNYISGRYVPELRTPSSEEEREYLRRANAWSSEEAAYIKLQETKPQTIGFALADSPVGLAAWIVEKFNGWSSAGALQSIFTMDELLTNISLYWFSNAMYSAMCLYKEARADIRDADWTATSATPVAIAQFPDEIPFPPYSHLSKYLNVVRWTRMQRGGHFAALESPSELAADIRAFFGGDRAETGL